MSATAALPEGCTAIPLPRMRASESWLFVGIDTGKAPVKEKSFLMLFIAYSPGSRLPASRGRADFRLKQTRIGHDSYPGSAVFSWFKLLASCQTLFSKLNSARLRSQPRQERFVSCSASDQTSARMSARTARATQNRSPLFGLTLGGCQ